MSSLDGNNDCILRRVSVRTFLIASGCLGMLAATPASAQLLRGTLDTTGGGILGTGVSLGTTTPGGGLIGTGLTVGTSGTGVLGTGLGVSTSAPGSGVLGTGLNVGTSGTGFSGPG